MRPLAHIFSLISFVLVLAGCASTEHQQVALTGNMLVDGPNAVVKGPPRDKVLWQYRTGAAAMRQGDFALARTSFDDALLTLQGAFGPDANARKSRSYFQGEAKKTFIGEP